VNLFLLSGTAGLVAIIPLFIVFYAQTNAFLFGFGFGKIVAAARIKAKYLPGQDAQDLQEVPLQVI